MIGFLFKNWKLFMDIILVVGGILAFTFWDPLGIFNNTKLQATANMVTGVRDIGQLVTAEYYGEVISSWKEFKITEFAEDTVSYKAENLYLALKLATSDVDKRFNRIYDDNFSKGFKDKYGEEFYYKFIAFIGNELMGLNIDKTFDEKDNDLKRNYEKKIIEFMYDDSKNFYKTLEKKYKNRPDSLVNIEFSNYLTDVPGFIDNFYAYHGLLTKKHLESGSTKRKEIVFIGRGWVKAGFDFGKLNEGNFMYDESNKSVHFFGIKPVILDTDINPWFIPERKIKGFELIEYSGDVDFEDAKAVKKQCKEKLLDQANRADIIERALENGKEALKSFFSLILDEPDIRVKFHTHPFDLHYAMIVADTLIDINEAIFIEELYQQQINKSKNAKSDEDRSMALKEQELMKYFIGQLKQLSFIDSGYQFNFYSMAAAKILKDTFHISLDDRQKLIDLRGILGGDTLKISTTLFADNPLWFDEVDFRDDFNSTMEVLEAEAISIEVDTLCDVWNKNFNHKGYSIFFKDKIARQGDEILLRGNDSLNFRKCDTSEAQLNFFADIQYDLNYKRLLNDSLGPDTTVYILNRYRDTVTYTQSIDTINRIELPYIIEAEKNMAIVRNKKNPIRNLIADVERYIGGLKKTD
jgi:hypothetical protein